MVNFFQHAIRQVQAAHLPAPLARHFTRSIVEVLVIRFQKTVVQLIALHVRPLVCAKQNAVRILHKEAPRAIGLAPQLADARTEVNIKVCAARKQRAHPAQVFCVAAHMRANEGGLRMALHNARQGIHNIKKGRERRRRKLPVRMRMQLFPAFVGCIQRVKECHGVGHMHHHRQAQLAGCRPQCVEARIVRAHKFVVLVAHMQAQRLPDFEALRSARCLQAQLRSRPLAKAVAVGGPLRPIHPAKNLEALRRAVFKMIEMGMQDVCAPAAIKVHVGNDTGLVQLIQQRGQRALVPAAAKRLSQMVVRIHNREARPRHGRGLGGKHSPRLEVSEQHASQP